MSLAPRFAAPLAALALALPAAAHAQGAGDDQYTDPFGGNSQQQSGSGNGNSGSQDSSGSSGSDSGSLAQSPPGGPGSEVQASTQERRADELARTGSEPGLVALLGAGMLLTGLGLRVRKPVA